MCYKFKVLMTCDMDDIFIDGTFKCCPKHIYQMYSIHGCNHGNYVPLLFALLPTKDKITYINFWKAVFRFCEDRSLVFKPKPVNVNFELAMQNVLNTVLPDTGIKGC